MPPIALASHFLERPRRPPRVGHHQVGKQRGGPPLGRAEEGLVDRLVAYVMDAPASGREGGLAQCRQGTAWTHGYDQHRRMRSSTAECVSSRALVGVQERAFRFSGPRYGEIWGDAGRDGERFRLLGRSAAARAGSMPPACRRQERASRAAASTRQRGRPAPPASCPGAGRLVGEISGDLGRSGEIWGDRVVPKPPSGTTSPHISPYLPLALSPGGRRAKTC